MELVGHLDAVGKQPGALLEMSVIMQSRGSAPNPSGIWRSG